MRCVLTIALVLTLTVGMTGCSDGSEIDRESEIAEISRTVDACIGWFKTKDFELLFDTVVHDSTFLSVHPTDRIVRGFEGFRENAETFRYPGFLYVRHELRDLTVTLSRSGDVAWFYCILDDINTWDGEPANWENARWTGVLEKREGRWVIMQQHFSFAAD